MCLVTSDYGIPEECFLACMDLLSVAFFPSPARDVCLLQREVHHKEEIDAKFQQDAERQKQRVGDLYITTCSQGDSPPKLCPISLSHTVFIREKYTFHVS